RARAAAEAEVDVRESGEAEGVRTVGAARVRLFQELGDEVDPARRRDDGAADPGRGVDDLPPAVPDAHAVLAERDLDAIRVQGERDGAVADPARALVRAHRQEHLLPADRA